jgi:uncharacterized membrane protein
VDVWTIIGITYAVIALWLFAVCLYCGPAAYSVDVGVGTVLVISVFWPVSLCIVAAGVWCIIRREVVRERDGAA